MKASSIKVKYRPLAENCPQEMIKVVVVFEFADESLLYEVVDHLAASVLEVEQRIFSMCRRVGSDNPVVIVAVKVICLLCAA